MAETTLTIRVDEKLKDEFQRAAEAEDRSSTEALTRLMKQHLARQCRTCGRSDELGVLPAGLTSAFGEFVESRKQKQNYTQVTVTTVEGTDCVSYWGRIDHLTITTGMLLLRISFEDAMREYQQPIPRGVISGWEEDAQGRLHGTYVGQGYIDGNARLRQAIMMAQFGMSIDAPGRGGRRKG